MIDRVAVLCVAAAALLSAVLVLELQASGESAQPAPTATRPQAQSAPATSRIRGPRVDELIETTLSRPLFAPTRRPPEQAKTDRPTDPGLGNIRLTGILIEADRHLAVFAVPGAKPLVRSEGEALNEWRLDSISLREVSLSGPGGFITLEPKSDPTLVRPTQAARPTVSPPQPSATAGRPSSPAVAAPQPKPPPRSPGAAGPPRAANVPRSRQ
jgi:general secretion pathway protein N